MPLGCFFKYGMAMRWSGAFAECLKLLEAERKKDRRMSQEKRAVFFLYEAALMNNMSRYKKSVSLLNKSTPKCVLKSSFAKYLT